MGDAASGYAAALTLAQDAIEEGARWMDIPQLFLSNGVNPPMEVIEQIRKGLMNKQLAYAYENFKGSPVELDKYTREIKRRFNEPARAPVARVSDVGEKTAAMLARHNIPPGSSDLSNCGSRWAGRHLHAR